MLFYRNIRYRVYPTKLQVQRLLAWQDSLRFLWNLANEQRELGLKRSQPRFYTFFDQVLQLAELRAALPWLADVPSDACTGMLRCVETAWRKYFSKIRSRPTWKKKGQYNPGVRYDHGKRIPKRVGKNFVLFTNLGKIRAKIHTPLFGRQTRMVLKRDGDQWFASILCVEERPDPTVSSNPSVGIDRGVHYLLADSNGRLVKPPARMLHKLVKAQRAVSRKVKGSRNQEKAKLRVMRVHREARRQRHALLHKESRYYANNHGVVVLEKLQIHNMTKSSKGTKENPGKKVRQKSGLNRAILASGWGLFRAFVQYKATETGSRVIEVPAHYTSQTCSACGAKASESRVSRAWFSCVTCGFSLNADVNAAKVILSRHSDGEAACGGQGAVRPPLKQESSNCPSGQFEETCTPNTVI